MKIVIAAWHLKDFNVGLGRYARGLIDAIGQVDHEQEYEILTPTDSYQFHRRSNIRYRVVRVPVFKRRLWEQVAPLICGRYALLHFPYDSCVFWKRGKFVTTIHDVKPLLFQTGRIRPSLLERLLMPDRRNQIDHVLTVSQASRRDIVRHVGFLEERITAIYPGVDLDRFRPINGSEVVHRAPFLSLGLKGRPYVLCVAGADPTKNVETLIEAFVRLPSLVREAHDLVLAGDFRRRQDLHAQVARSGIENQIIFTGVVTDEVLIQLYQQGALFVFPSRYEGFGLPVLEAMACGCPVISSNSSSLPEVAGDAALLRHPDDLEGFAQDMERVLMDAGLRQSLRERGLAQASKFPWERTARETIAVYQNVLIQTKG